MSKSKFVVEVTNVKRRGPAFVMPGRLVTGSDGRPRVEVSASGVLVLDPSEDQPTRVRLTSAQFQEYSYDLEGKSEGKYGCERELQLNAVDVQTGERAVLSYREAAELVAANLNDDAAALEDQAKQAAELAKAASDLEEGEEEDGSTENFE